MNGGDPKSKNEPIYCSTEDEEFRCVDRNDVLVCFVVWYCVLYYLAETTTTKTESFFDRGNPWVERTKAYENWKYEQFKFQQRGLARRRRSSISKNWIREKG